MFGIMLKFLLFLAISSIVSAFDVPCTVNIVGGPCRFDEECYGVNTVCLNERCSCPVGFDVSVVNSNVRTCVPAPDRDGASCTKHCQPPLLCDDRTKKCICFQGNVVNGKCQVSCRSGHQVRGYDDNSCVRVAHYNQACSRDKDCVDSFNICSRGRCLCAAGTKRNGNTCTGYCPDGKPADNRIKSCRRFDVNDIDLLDHANRTDTCPDGYYCATYGSPHIGHCCRLFCPHGMPINRYTCEAGIQEGRYNKNRKRKCPTDTHYCHKIQSTGSMVSVCCPRPCREPTPLFIDGNCLPLSHLGDPCRKDEQCEGGKAGMTCSRSKICQCKNGYVKAFSRAFATCVKQCPIGKVSVLNDCKSVKTAVCDTCVVDKECPLGSRCYHGRCECKCGYNLAKNKLTAEKACMGKDGILSALFEPLSSAC